MNKEISDTNKEILAQEDKVHNFIRKMFYCSVLLLLVFLPAIVGYVINIFV